MACQPAIYRCFFFAVAFDTKTHLKTPALESIHGLNRTMAFLTFNLLFNVPLMVEKYMFRHKEHFLPRNGLLSLQKRVLLLNPGMIGNDVSMTKKAFFDRWNPGMYRSFHVRMTKPTLNRLNAGMHPMAKRDRLRRPDSHRRGNIKEIDKKYN